MLGPEATGRLVEALGPELTAQLVGCIEQEAAGQQNQQTDEAREQQGVVPHGVASPDAELAIPSGKEQRQAQQQQLQQAGEALGDVEAHRGNGAVSGLGGAAAGEGWPTPDTAAGSAAPDAGRGQGGSWHAGDGADGGTAGAVSAPSVPGVVSAAGGMDVDPWREGGDGEAGDGGGSEAGGGGGSCFTASLVAAMGPRLTSRLVESMGAALTAELVGAMGPRATAAVVQVRGPVVAHA